MSLSPTKRIKRIIQRRRTGDPQDPDDWSALLNAVSEAMRTGESIDHCFGLPTGWAEYLLNEEFCDALFDLSCASKPMDRDSSEDIVDKLNSYKRARFGRNIENEHFPEGRDGCLHRVLLRFGGEVPAAETIRKYHSLNRKCGDRSRLSVPKTGGNKAA